MDPLPPRLLCHHYSLSVTFCHFFSCCCLPAAFNYSLFLLSFFLPRDIFLHMSSTTYSFCIFAFFMCTNFCHTYCPVAVAVLSSSQQIDHTHCPPVLNAQGSCTSHCLWMTCPARTSLGHQECCKLCHTLQGLT